MKLLTSCRPPFIKPIQKLLIVLQLSESMDAPSGCDRPRGSNGPLREWILYSWGRVWVHHLSLSSRHYRSGDWQWWPPPITVPAVADSVFYCLFMYANEWWEKSYCWNGDRQWSPPPITVLVVDWTQAQVVKLTLLRLEKKHSRLCLELGCLGM